MSASAEDIDDALACAVAWGSLASEGADASGDFGDGDFCVGDGLALASEGADASADDAQQGLIDDALACALAMYTDDDVDVCVGRKRRRVSTPFSGELHRSAAHIEWLNAKREVAFEKKDKATKVKNYGAVSKVWNSDRLRDRDCLGEREEQWKGPGNRSNQWQLEQVLRVAWQQVNVTGGVCKRYGLDKQNRELDILSACSAGAWRLQNAVFLHMLREWLQSIELWRLACIMMQHPALCILSNCNKFFNLWRGIRI